MKRPTFEETISVLVKAYLNNTLVHGNCAKCAVGNIISQGNKSYDFYEHDISWFKAIGLNSCHPDTWVPTHPDVIKTGYEPSELIAIENAFERGYNFLETENENFAGLMAVVDVLASIHNVDLNVKEEAKKLFVKV